jgi:hypothetical protein
MNKFNFQRICDFESLNSDYENSIFLTFDIDWASDEVLNYTIDLLEEYNAKATFFVTHKTPVLERLRASNKFELGIHPNFNFLLNGDFRYGKNYKEVIQYYLDMVPDAVSVRSHSLTQSAQIIDEFIVKGLKFDLNLLLMHISNMELRPIPYYADNFIRLPYFWEDDTSILYNKEICVEELLAKKGLKIFDFHPIHVFLNSYDLNQYDLAKPYLQTFDKLKEFKNYSKGTCSFIKELMNQVFNSYAD